MQIILLILAALISVYSLLCLIRIIITWIPGLSYSNFARVLSDITDPYLNVFRGKKWLCVAGLDFGPALAISILGALAALISSINRGGLHFGFILATIISLIWNIAASVISFILIILVIRLIFFLLKKDTSAFWDMVDGPINQMSGAITKPFSGGKPVTFKARLIASIIVLVLVDVIGTLLFQFICTLVSHIPF